MRMSRMLAIALLCAVVGPVWAQADEGVAGERSLAETLRELLPAMGADEHSARRDAQQQWQEICFRLGAPGNEAKREEACRLMAQAIGRDTPTPARVWLLEQLARLGRAESVQPLAAALSDPEATVRDAARRALANNPTPEAGAKLREALRATRDEQRRIGLIHALGFRAEPANVAVLADELSSQHEAVANAAASALGRIATAAAAEALAVAYPDATGSVKLNVGDAWLRCAERLAEQGKTAEAETIYRELYESGDACRLGALEGMLNIAGDGAPTIVLRILSGRDAEAQRVAVGFVRHLDSRAIAALARGLPYLPASGQVALLDALGERRDRTALPAVLAAVGSENEQVRIAALRALGGVGDASSVSLLVETMLAGGEPGAAARRSLESVFADGVDQRLTDIMKSTEGPEDRATLIEILDRRRATSAVPALLEEILGEDGNVRRRAMSALGNLAQPDDVAGMIRGMMRIEDPGELDNAQQAITSVCRRIVERGEQAEPVLAVYGNAGERERNALLPLLGRIGGAQALSLIRAALAGGDSERFGSAVRAICSWPEADVAEDLARLAETVEDEGQRVEIVRALARVVVLPSGRSDLEKLALLKRAMKQAIRDEDRRLILDRAKEVRHFDTVRFAAAHLDSPKLAEQACRTIVDLLGRRELRGPNQAECDKILEKVIQVTNDRGRAERARELMSGRKA
ncbi:MAG: HEAT repeat domain-containing protein [Armatimonadota bacterium]